MEDQALTINSETVLAEAKANTAYVALGFFCVPLLFIFIGFDKSLGTTVKEVFAASIYQTFHNPFILGLMIILEILMSTAYMRIYQQKLVLTATTLITYTGYLKNHRSDIPLKDIKSIRLLEQKDRLTKRMNCGTVIVETMNGTKLEFPIIKNPHAFVNKVKHQIFKSN